MHPSLFGRIGIALAIAACAASAHADPTRAASPSAKLAAPAPQTGRGGSPKPANACAHVRPFTFREQLALPAPFDGLTPCDALKAILPDYDKATEHSAAAGGPARIYSVRRWDTGGRTLLGVVYYVGESVTEEFVCGQCHVDARLAVVERDGNGLRLVAKAPSPWGPRKNEALFDGTAELDLAPVAFQDTDTLLPMRTTWSTGKPGSWRSLSLYRLDGTALRVVFDQRDQWFASGMGTEDDDVVASTIAPESRPSGPVDLRITTTERRCHIDLEDLDGPPICGKDAALGTELWRFSGKAYKRIRGKAPPLPKVLHKLWGW